MIKYLAFTLVFFQAYCLADYHSQCGQDRFVNETFFNNMENGVFLDIGAHDGISLSNTCFFEKDLNWTGICVEPIPEMFKKLQKNRKCICICGCIANEHNTWKDFLYVSGPHILNMFSGIVDTYDPYHLQRVENYIKEGGGSSEVIKVPCYNINHVLEEAGITHVNFLSLDTEGGEFEILQSIDFSKVQIDVIAVEDNHTIGGDYKSFPFISFLESKGFDFVRVLEWDLIFVNKNFNLN